MKDQIPQQDNGVDCGVFMIKILEYLVDDLRPDFEQKDIANFRQRMAAEILGTHLLDDDYTCIPKPKRNLEDDYNISKDEKMGKGSFGIVYRGSSKSTKKEFAIKQAKKGPMPSIEKEILKKMQFSPYYCRFIDEYKDGLVMELCSRDTLSCERKKHGSGYFGPQLGALKGIEIIRAIQYLHASNYIHRDIKPSNLLIPATEKRNKTWNNHLFL